MKQPLNLLLDRQMQRLLGSINDKTPMDEVKQILDLAIKYEALKLKDKSGNWGRGFGDDDDNKSI
jgi:hypothetical protein